MGCPHDLMTPCACRPYMKRSPYLFDTRLEGGCVGDGCAAPAVRVLVLVDRTNDDDSEVTVAFYCDTCADATHASFMPAEGTA